MATTTTAIVATAKAEGTTAAVEVVEVETTTDHPVTEDEMEETVEGTATVEAVDTAAEAVATIAEGTIPMADERHVATTLFAFNVGNLFLLLFLPHKSFRFLHLQNEPLQRRRRWSWRRPRRQRTRSRHVPHDILPFQRHGGRCL